MTAPQFVRLLIRRWYIVLIGAALTLPALYLVSHQHGVYWTQVNVVLLAPPEKYYPNKIRDPHYALAPMAGVVVAQWNENHEPLLTASGDTTLFGEGMRQGIQVRMPNQGSQWRPLFLTPNIDVQVVGTDPAQVEREAVETTNELATILRQRQVAMGVDPELFITSVLAPDVPTIAYVSGSRVRALLATLVVGVLLTCVAAIWFDRFRRRSSKNPSAPSPNPDPAQTVAESSTQMISSGGRRP